jgi:hypothetical protein
VSANLEIVCYRNQMRSPFLASFLMSHFESMNITSSGVAVLPKSNYDPLAQLIAKEWGFPYQIRNTSQTVSDSNRKCYLAVDSSIFNKLKLDYSVSCILEPDQSYEVDPFGLPRDPVKLETRELKFELAKLLSYGAKQVNKILKNYPKDEISCVIPKIRPNYTAIFGGLQGRLRRHEISIIDASLKYSNFGTLDDLNFPLIEPLQSLEMGKVYSFNKEVREAEKFLCSPNWREWLQSLSQLGNVVIVAPPLFSEEGFPIWDSFLASIWTEKNIYV